ncbi:hypothetical protein CDEF62S_04135 [Castellaniella defragrans]
MTSRGSRSAHSVRSCCRMLAGLSRCTVGAPAAIQVAGAGVEQLEMVVEFRHGPHGAARIAHRVHLVDRDGRQDAFDAVHLRLVHAVQELAGVRGKTSRRSGAGLRHTACRTPVSFCRSPRLRWMTSSSPVCTVTSRFLRLFWRAPKIRIGAFMAAIIIRARRACDERPAGLGWRAVSAKLLPEPAGANLVLRPCPCGLRGRCRCADWGCLLE